MAITSAILTSVVMLSAQAADHSPTLAGLESAREEERSWATRQFEKFGNAKSTDEKFAAAFPFVSKKDVFEILKLEDAILISKKPLDFVQTVFDVVSAAEKNFDRVQLEIKLPVKASSLPPAELPLTVPSVSKKICTKSVAEEIVKRYGHDSAILIMTLNAMYIDLFRLQFSKKLSGLILSKSLKDRELIRAYYSFFENHDRDEVERLIAYLVDQIHAREKELADKNKLSLADFPKYPLRAASTHPECLYGFNSDFVRLIKR